MSITEVGSGIHSRRRMMRLSLLALAGFFLPAHAPYGQWGVYRKKHLLILTTKADPESFELGKKLAALILKELPDSLAQVSRAPHKARIASLISSHQIELALMRGDDAAALLAGADPYKNYGAVPLTIIAAVDDFLLVCREDFAPHHAWLIAEALQHAQSAFAVAPGKGPKPVSPDRRLPLHPGVVLFLSGAAMPSLPEKAPAEHVHD